LSVAVLVTVVGPDGLAADLAVPAEVPIAELLGGVRAALLGLSPVPPAQPAAEPPTGGVTLALLGGAPLPPARSLAGCGIGDGAVLVLRDGSPHGPPPARPSDHPAGPGPATTPGWFGWPGAAPGRVDRPRVAGLPERWPSPVAGWPERWPSPVAGLPAPWPSTVRFSRALRAACGGPGWRRSVARGRRAWQDGSYERRLLAALAAAPLTRCAVVGVLGATPGAGATTVTALLAAALAAGRPGRTAAVDASPGGGSLTELLAPGHDLFVDELVALLGHPLLTRRELGAILARRGELAVLAARPGAASPDEPGWNRVVRALAAHATTVVADCGPGASAGARAVLAVADQFVLVADASSPSAAVAAADLLAERGRPPVLLLNHADGGVEAAEVVRWAAGVRGAVVVPADPAAAAALRAAPARGAPSAPLGGVSVPARWRRQADELAVLLATEWPSLGLERA